MRLYPSQKTNLFYGYHSKKAHTNQQSWSFAQRLFTMFLIRTGIIGILLSAAFFSVSLNIFVEIGIMVFYNVLAILLIKFKTEKQLNKLLQHE